MSEAKPPAQRQREARQRRRKDGGGATYVILTPIGLASLEQLVQAGLTKTQAINQALAMFAAQR